MDDIKRYMQKRKESGAWYYVRRVPNVLASFDKRRLVRKSTHKRSFAEAAVIANNFNEETEAYWQALMETGVETGSLKRYQKTLERARLLGVKYRPIEDLASGELDDIIARLERLESNRLMQSRNAVTAVLGGEKQPGLQLSAMLKPYFELTRDRLTKKAPDQVRKWKNPRRKAVNNLIALIGDKPLALISRDDALDFRSWWLDRVLQEGYDPGSANKDIGHLNQIINELDDKYRLELGRPFAGMRLKGEQHNKRVAYEIQFVRDRLLQDGALDVLNEEARMVVYVVAELGMRPSEIVNLTEQDIYLDVEVPYVRVVEREREIKTRHSQREIPLTGVALAALQKYPQGFLRYRGKADSFSALVNQALSSAGLRPTKGHTLYSLRHTFQDRLTAMETPERIEAELMGHKFSRPLYGSGPSLKQKAGWLHKISFPVPESLR